MTAEDYADRLSESIEMLEIELDNGCVVVSVAGVPAFETCRFPAEILAVLRIVR